MSEGAKTVGGLVIRRITRLDAAVRALLQARNVCTVCTIGAHSTIHAQPVWVDTDGEHVLLNSVDGRAWVRNVRRGGPLTCSVINLENVYEHAEVRGHVDTITSEGADDHIHRMAKKYLGLDEYPWLLPSRPRILIRITPDTILHTCPEAVELED